MELVQQNVTVLTTNTSFLFGSTLSFFGKSSLIHVSDRDQDPNGLDVGWFWDFREKRQSSSSLEWGGDGFVVFREREDKRIKNIQEG